MNFNKVMFSGYQFYFAIFVGFLPLNDSFANSCKNLLTSSSVSNDVTDLKVDDPAIFFRTLTSIPFRAALIRAYEKTMNKWIVPPYGNNVSAAFGTNYLSPSNLQDSFSLNDPRLKKTSHRADDTSISYIEPVELEALLADLDPLLRQKITEYAIELVVDYFTIFVDADAQINFRNDLLDHGISIESEREILDVLSMFKNDYEELASIVSALISERALFSYSYYYAKGQITPGPAINDLAVSGIIGILIGPLTGLVTGSVVQVTTGSSLLTALAVTTTVSLALWQNYVGFRNISLDSQDGSNKKIRRSIEIVTAADPRLSFVMVPEFQTISGPFSFVGRALSWKAKDNALENSETPLMLQNNSVGQEQFYIERHEALLVMYNENLSKAQSFLSGEMNPNPSEKLRSLIDVWRSIKGSIIEINQLQSALITHISNCRNDCRFNGAFDDASIASIQNRISDVDSISIKLREVLAIQLSVFKALQREILAITSSEEYDTTALSSSFKEAVGVELVILSGQVEFLDSQIESDFIYQLVSGAKVLLENVQREARINRIRPVSE